jgi:hypothetical protein
MAESSLGPRLDLARFTPVNRLCLELAESCGLVLLLSQRSTCVQLLQST